MCATTKYSVLGATTIRLSCIVGTKPTEYVASKYKFFLADTLVQTDARTKKRARTTYAIKVQGKKYIHMTAINTSAYISNTFKSNVEKIENRSTLH